MATEVPQRQLRNETAALLRRVEAGEHLRITVHGHPVADLVPVQRRAAFVPREQLLAELGGLLGGDVELERDIRDVDDSPRDPFQ